MKNSDVSIVLPTLAEKKRESNIKRCVNSIRESSRSRVQILAIVNGYRYDDGLCDWLNDQNDIAYRYVSEPSLPNAIFVGRKLVRTSFFGFLDDDDELLPGAIDQRLEFIANSPETDLVVSNGLVRRGGKEFLYKDDFSKTLETPLESLLRVNWLSSCGGLYRSESFPPEFFSDYHAYAEWTWFAYKLTLDDKRIAVLGQPTFRINDTPDSLSKSDAYYDAYSNLYKRMLTLDPPAYAKKMILRRLASDYHNSAERKLREGKIRESIRDHFKSLALPDGLKYLPFTRKYLIPNNFK